MRRKTHILIIDGEGIARDGLCALLQQDEGLHVDATFANAREALRVRPRPASADRHHGLRDWP